MDLEDFKKTIWQHYGNHKRDFIWREKITPYNIVVSEIMLQQTQADRVAKKFPSFIEKYPSFPSLSSAPLQEVLKEWQGLGYNRRALNLHRLATIVTEKYKGKLPRTYEELLDLPAIGPNTAGSIMAFAFNLPRPFIETNIRTVFIHFFFKNSKTKVDDKKIFPLIEKTLDVENPREWYYALMDYGNHLKKTTINPSRRSKHHVRQSTFKGSNRELRAQILRFILEKPRTVKEIVGNFREKEEENIQNNILQMEKEGFIEKKKTKYAIKS